MKKLAIIILLINLTTQFITQKSSLLQKQKSTQKTKGEEEEDEGPDKKLIFGSTGFYQTLSLSEEEFKITFRTYIEYEQKLFLPLQWTFKVTDNKYEQHFQPTTDQVGEAISNTKELEENTEKVKTYVDNIQYEIGKRILFIGGYYGRISNSFIIKPQLAYILFASKMVEVLKLKPIVQDEKKLSYEFALMFEQGQLVFVSVQMDGVGVVKALKLLQDILLNEYDNQKTQLNLIEDPNMYKKCEQKYTKKPCPKQGFRFKQMLQYKYKAKYKQNDKDDDDEEDDKEAEKQEERSILELKKKNKRDALKKVIAVDILKNSLFNKQLFSFFTDKKDDIKIKKYLELETDEIMKKSLKKFSGPENVDLAQIMNKKAFKNIIKENKKQFLEQSKVIIGKNTQLDEKVVEKLKKLAGTLDLVVNLQAKAMQFYLFQDSANEEAKENKKKMKLNQAQDEKISMDLEKNIQDKGKIDQADMEKKQKLKEKQNEELQIQKEFTAKQKETEKKQKEIINKLIFTKQFDSEQFNDYFKIVEYKNIYKNMQKNLSKDKNVKLMFIQKLNAYFLSELQFKTDGELNLDQIKTFDLHSEVLQKVGDDQVPVDMCKDQVLDNYFYHGGYMDDASFTRFSVLDKLHLAQQQQLIPNTRRRRR